MWTSKHPTLGRFWSVVDVPRGPVMGCHVAPCGWFVVLYKIVWFHRGSNPRPSLRATHWQDRANHPGHVGSYYEYDKEYI